MKRRRVMMMTKFYDVRSARPAHTDKYFIDTNAWFWLTYCASREIDSGGPGERKTREYKKRVYSKYIEKALDAGAKLYHCPLVFSELANVIEVTEHKIYQRSSGKEISRKAFRNIASERKKVLAEVDLAWKTISQMSCCVDVKLSTEMIGSVQTLLGKVSVDPYDAFYIQVMKSEGISSLVTDDRDFRGAELENIYTLNLP